MKVFFKETTREEQIKGISQKTDLCSESSLLYNEMILCHKET